MLTSARSSPGRADRPDPASEGVAGHARAPNAVLHRPQTPEELREIEGLVREGLLRRVAGDVFTEVAAPDDATLRIASARLLMSGHRLGDDAAVCGTSALWLWVGGPPPPRLQVLRPVGGGRAATGWLELRESRIAARDTVTLDGVRLTTPVRTACDLARWLDRDPAVAALRQLQQVAGATPEEVSRALEGLSRCRGVTAARSVVAVWRRG